MPSYARTVKDELARIFDDEENCLRAELAAMLKVGTIFNEGRIEFSTVSGAVARKLIKLLNKFFPDAKREVATVRNKGSAKSIRYFIKIFLAGDFEKFFNAAADFEILPDDFTRVAYLRGAFMAGGTVNKPEAQYYLEIASMSANAAIFVNQIWADLEFNPVMRVRKEFFVNYICEGDAVEEFLGMVGAEEAVERFQIARNLKEVRANVNRLVNVETANLNKAVESSRQQIADINILLKNNIEVSADYKVAMDARLEFPEDTLHELAAKLFISRQGLCYRFKKIHELAQEISGKEKIS